jgi:hypothetical protein
LVENETFVVGRGLIGFAVDIAGGLIHRARRC